MNIGIYTYTLAINDETELIVDALNSGIENGDVTDGSVFFNTVGFNPKPMKFGCFNAADMWNFTGTLVTTTLGNFFKTTGIVNKAKLVYYHGWEENAPVLSLINVSNMDNVDVVCNSDKKAKEYYRLTGKHPKGTAVGFNTKELVKAVTK